MVCVERIGDPKQPALDQTRQSNQDADTRNRGPLAEQRGGIIEQPQISELPIESPVARVRRTAGLLRLAHRRDRLHGWGGRTRTSMCIEKIHLFDMSRKFGFRRPGGDGCGPEGE
jgi:hypothetical protein